MEVTAETVIYRPRPDVASFAMNPDNDTRWIGGIVHARSLSDPPLSKGTRVERTAKYLGKRIEYVNEVVEHDPVGMLVMRSVSGPFQMTIRYQFEESPGGTLARIQVQGEAGGFFKVAGPVLAQMVKRNVTKDLKTLKQLLESEAGDTQAS